MPSLGAACIDCCYTRKAHCSPNWTNSWLGRRRRHTCAGRAYGGPPPPLQPVVAGRLHVVLRPAHDAGAHGSDPVALTSTRTSSRCSSIRSAVSEHRCSRRAVHCRLWPARTCHRHRHRSRGAHAPSGTRNRSRHRPRRSHSRSRSGENTSVLGRPCTCRQPAVLSTSTRRVVLVRDGEPSLRRCT
jgi:hypothetical protein